MSSAPEALHEYLNWLSIERYRVAAELGLPPDADRTELQGPAYDWHAQHKEEAPSTRAERVLSAVGCEWRAPW